MKSYRNLLIRNQQVVGSTPIFGSILTYTKTTVLSSYSSHKSKQFDRRPAVVDSGPASGNRKVSPGLACHPVVAKVVIQNRFEGRFNLAIPSIVQWQFAQTEQMLAHL